MSIKSFASKVFASIVVKKIQSWSKHPIETQEAVFESLIEKARDTSFGEDHNFVEIQSHADYVKYVPINARAFHSYACYIMRKKIFNQLINIFGESEKSFHRLAFYANKELFGTNIDAGSVCSNFFHRNCFKKRSQVPRDFIKLARLSFGHCSKTSTIFVYYIRGNHTQGQVFLHYKI